MKAKYSFLRFFPAAEVSAIITYAFAPVCLVQMAMAAPESMMAAADSITGTHYKATKDMATVLTPLRGLGGKPIESSTLTEAGQQPTVADAAKALLTSAASVVVSADYWLAPDAKFPAARDDALAAYKHIAINAASMKGDVIAVYPVAQTDNMSTESYVDSAMAKPLHRAMIGWFVDELLAKPSDKINPRLDVIPAALTGLPPVTIIKAQIDPLRSDGALLEHALQQAGGKVERKSLPSTYTRILWDRRGRHGGQRRPDIGGRSVKTGVQAKLLQMKANLHQGSVSCCRHDACSIV